MSVTQTEPEVGKILNDAKKIIRARGYGAEITRGNGIEIDEPLVYSESEDGWVRRFGTNVDYNADEDVFEIYLERDDPEEAAHERAEDIGRTLEQRGYQVRLE